MLKFRRPVVALSALLVVVLLAAGCGLLREPETASAPLEAVPLEIETPAAAAVVEATDVAPQEPVATEAAAEEIVATEAPAADEPAAEPEAAPEEAAAPESGGLRIFSLDPGASLVRFELDEDLRGTRTTVVGVTNQLAGELAIDPADLSTAQLGVILINARGLATENNFRNRAIQNEILDTGSFEFISFEPTSIEGLPGSAAVGDTVQFAVSGNLTIRDIVQPATFTVEATFAGDNQISGLASTVVNRADYNLVIPNVPNVANVEEEVELYIEFTANAG